jgi:hypothetical protein
MKFDCDAVKSFRQIINDETAYGVFLYDWAVRKEIENHLSVQLFESSPSARETLLKLLSHYIEMAGTKSIIGFTEDDPALSTIVTWISMRMNLPFYSYNMEDPGALSQFIRPEVCPCSLFVPYSANAIQVNEVIRIFIDKMIPIKQVISLVEEHPLKIDFQKLKIEYVSITNWNSIRERIKKFQNLTPEKISELLGVFK